MPRVASKKNFAHTLISNSGVAIGPTATSIPVVSTADFPDPSGGYFTIRIPSTGECIEVRGVSGNIFTPVVRGLPEGATGTYSGVTIPDGVEVDEIWGAADIAHAEDYLPPIDASNITSGTISSARLPATVSSIKKTGSAALTGDVTLTPGTNVTLTQAGQDITIAASGGSVADATTTTVGVVEVDHAPSGAHPVALTTDGVAVPSGMLGTASTKAAAGNDSRLSDSRTPTAGSVVDASVNASAAIAESKLTLASDAAAGTPSRRTLGTGATQAAAGNDSRLSDTRTPTDGSVTTAKIVDANVTSAKLADSGVSAATYGDATHVPTIAVDAKGRITSASNTVITGGGGGSSTLAGDTDVSLTSPVAGNHLYYDGTHWVNVGPTKTQLDFALASDLAFGAIGTATWTDFTSNQNFTVDDTNSLILIEVNGNAIVGNSNAYVSGRIVIDSAGTPINKKVGGGYNVGSGAFSNVANGAVITIAPGTLTAATHTVKFQGYTSTAGSMECTASTNPDRMHLAIRVIEVPR